MRLLVNGEHHDLGEGGTVASLLQTLELDGRRLGVELNREIVPKSAYAETRLHEGDAVEIVHFVGGG